MHNAKKILSVVAFAVLLCLFALRASGQQLPVYSQYMMNKFLINPAVAGSEGYTAFNLTSRKQWLGIKDAPLTFAASGQTRLPRGNSRGGRSQARRFGGNLSRVSRVGLGGYIFNDRHGLVSRSGLQLTYAYHIPFDNSQLSFGLSGTFWQFRLDRASARIFDPDDELFNSMDNSLFIPDANLGVYYSDERFFAGFSADQLFQSSFKFGGKGYEQYKLLRHFYLMGGYNFLASDKIVLEPTMLIKTTHEWTFQMDLTMNAYFVEDYWAGLSYRTPATVVLMGGVRVDKFYFGYAFDFSFNSIMYHSYGSHEILIAMKLGEGSRQFKWLQRH
jgi:type IX secretion system PorP/SprF family membrane protein